MAPARLILMTSAATRSPGASFAVVVTVLVGVGFLASVGPQAGGGTSDRSDRSGTVTGVVLRPATCPVARAERACAARPVAGARVSLWWDGRRIAETQTDARGEFRLSGPTSHVEVRASDPSGRYVARTSRAVTLRPGTSSRVRLLLDNGVR